jgi:hypothetical protein
VAAVVVVEQAVAAAAVVRAPLIRKQLLERGPLSVVVLLRSAAVPHDSAPAIRF